MSMKQQNAGCKQILTMIREAKNLSEQVHSQSEYLQTGSGKAIVPLDADAVFPLRLSCRGRYCGKRPRKGFAC